MPPILIRRLKSHFVSLPCGVDLILGLNGYIWVSKHVKQNEQEGEEGFDAQAVYSNRNDVRNPNVIRGDLLLTRGLRRILTMRHELQYPVSAILSRYWPLISSP